MKTKITTALLLTILVIGCKKEDNNLNKNNGGSAPQTSNVSSTETYLVGHWYLDSMVYYSNNVATIVTVASAANQNDYEYNVYSTAYSGGTSTAKNMSYGRIGQSQTAVFWYVSDVYLNSTGLLFLNGSGPGFSGYIINACANKLAVAPSYGAIKQGTYFYLHK